MDSFDIVVIGNGVLGLSTAHALVQLDPKLRIAVVGRASRPMGATPAAGAMLSCMGEITSTLVASRLGDIKIELGLRALDLWPAWLATLNERAGAGAVATINPGTWIVRNTVSGGLEDDNYDAIKRAAQRYEQPYEPIDPATIPGYNPAPGSRARDGIYLPREGSLDSGALLGVLEAAAKHQDVRAIDDEVRELRLERGKVIGVALESGRALACDRALLAGGARSQSVLDRIPELRFRVPRLVSGQGTSLLLACDSLALPGVLRTSNRAFGCALHAVPRTRNLLYVGATNNVRLDPADRSPVFDLSFLLECLMDQIDQNLNGARLEKINVGNRPVTIDGCPLIGATTSVSGLVILGGTYRDGLHLSPVLAPHVAALLVGKSSRLVGDDVFAPERKPINLFATRAAAVEQTFLHYGSHQIHIPRVGWHDAFRRMTRRTIESVYAELDDDFILPPEMVSIIDNDRATMLPWFREYYEGVRNAWA